MISLEFTMKATTDELPHFTTLRVGNRNCSELTLQICRNDLTPKTKPSHIGCLCCNMLIEFLSM